MAARKNKITLTDEWKEKIRISHIINRLNQGFDGKVELTSDQIRIADMLLKKVVPDLSRVDGSMDVNIRDDERLRAISNAKEPS